LLHAPWAGCTLADLVFPFFVFSVGAALPLSVGAHTGLDRARVRRLARRSAWLVVIGIALAWAIALPQPDAPFLILGVLQRIGIAFFVAALIVASTGWRAWLAIASGLLAAYWIVVAWLPVPGFGAPDPFQPGLNFSSWLDPALLGRDLVLMGSEPHPYDPEGLLGTLVACVAQMLLGALAVEWLRRPGAPARRTLQVAAAGLGLALAGWLWSFSHPWVKSVWTSSYVLWSSGLATLLLAALHAGLDRGGHEDAVWVRFFRAFGVNALPAYVLHTLLLGIETSAPAQWMVRALEGPLPPVWASLPSILLVLVGTALPMLWLQRRNVIWKV
jgi:predicted acyltransferase